MNPAERKIGEQKERVENENGETREEGERLAR